MHYIDNLIKLIILLVVYILIWSVNLNKIFKHKKNSKNN